MGRFCPRRTRQEYRGLARRGLVRGLPGTIMRRPAVERMQRFVKCFQLRVHFFFPIRGCSQPVGQGFKKNARLSRFRQGHWA